MNIVYNDPIRRFSLENELGLHYAEFDHLLAQSDFITIHVNLTPNTHHLIGSKELDKLKETCILVNTSRGPVVDLFALYEALRERKIAYAALDVTEPEPIPTDHPLLTLENVIITPHIASATVATRTKMALIAAENLIAGLKGDLPPHCVNPEALTKLHSTT
jgi:glyoxylate reductase